VLAADVRTSAAFLFPEHEQGDQVFDEFPPRHRRRPAYDDDFEDDFDVGSYQPPDGDSDGEDPATLPEQSEASVSPALDYFRDEGWISHVIQQVKSGKEATVYCCAAGLSTGFDLLAAKLYRAREARTFRNDAIYQAGRVILDRRMGRAFKKKTAKGREVQYALWINHEWETLRRLRAVGADVPTPVARTDSALLMSYYGDAETAAPRLQDVTLRPDEAGRLFERLMRNVELWLANDTVHGDLSAFNVLYWQGQATVIDFPQAVDPRFNPHARDLLRRDVENLCRYFGRFGVRADAARITDSLWRRFLRAEL
jgi:RIO kinase 1